MTSEENDNEVAPPEQRERPPGNEAEILARISVPTAAGGDRSPPWAALSRQERSTQTLVRNWIVSPVPIPDSGIDCGSIESA